MFTFLLYFFVSGLISDLDLDNLDLDSATDPVDLDSLDGTSVDLKLDDLWAAPPAEWVLNLMDQCHSIVFVILQPQSLETYFAISTCCIFLGGYFFLLHGIKNTSILIFLSQTCQHGVKKSQDFVQTGHFCCERTWGLWCFSWFYSPAQKFAWVIQVVLLLRHTPLF